MAIVQAQAKSRRPRDDNGEILQEHHPNYFPVTDIAVSNAAARCVSFSNVSIADQGGGTADQGQPVNPRDDGMQECLVIWNGPGNLYIKFHRPAARPTAGLASSAQTDPTTDPAPPATAAPTATDIRLPSGLEYSHFGPFHHVSYISDSASAGILTLIVRW